MFYSDSYASQSRISEITARKMGPAAKKRIRATQYVLVMYVLAMAVPRRHSFLHEPLAAVPGLANLLAQGVISALELVEGDGLVWREAYPQIPPKVEYGLTERGASLMEVLDAMCAWGSKHRGWKKAEPFHTEAS